MNEIELPEEDIGGKRTSESKSDDIPLSTVSFILVFGTDLVKGRDELVEGLPVDDEASRALRWVADNVGRSKIVSGILENNIAVPCFCLKRRNKEISYNTLLSVKKSWFMAKHWTMTMTSITLSKTQITSL